MYRKCPCCGQKAISPWKFFLKFTSKRHGGYTSIKCNACNKRVKPSPYWDFTFITLTIPAFMIFMAFASNLPHAWFKPALCAFVMLWFGIGFYLIPLRPHGE